MILDGTKLNREIALVLKEKISAFKTVPTMIAIQVGDNASSNIYLSRKVKYAEQIGAVMHIVKFPDNVKEIDLINQIHTINTDGAVHGVIVQLPIPKHIDVQKIINTIKPDKDVDGLCATNIYKLVNHDVGLVPATARGVVTLLQKNEINLDGAKVAVVGRSLLVGKSTALHLLNQNATVTVCHSKTKNLAEQIKNADVVVLATGHPGVVADEMFSSNHVVVDVGITVVDGKVSGDAQIAHPEKLRAYSPVPGGVGPMTVASLFENLVQAYEMQNL